MSAMSEACPMCGTPTNENVQTANTSSKNETEKCEQTSNVSEDVFTTDYYSIFYR